MYTELYKSYDIDCITLHDIQIIKLLYRVLFSEMYIGVIQHIIILN